MVTAVIADPTRVDLVARAAVVPQHAASEAARQQERHYSGRPRGDTFIPLAIEMYGALLSRTDEFLRGCARRAFSEHGGSPPSTSVLVTRRFRQRVAVTLQRAQARAIHARTARLEKYMFMITERRDCHPLTTKTNRPMQVN